MLMTSVMLKLVNGVEVPQLALGTWMIKEGVDDVVETALKVGYRHIDTAQAYGNEAGVAEGIRRAGLKREEVFITSKINADYKTYEEAAKSIDETLRVMGLDYIDMLIIHCPQKWADWNQTEYRYFDENREVWRALEEAYMAKKIRAIGVSNFHICDLENIMKDCRIKPMVNQILCYISNTPVELIEYCQKNDIAVEAYSPVAHGEAATNEYIVNMANKYGVSAAQLCIRYCFQLGCITLPKSKSESHQRENAEIDFEISKEDMETLKYLEKNADLSAMPNFGR